MHVYRVENMTCGHCVRTIEKAIHARQESAEVDADLASGTVRVRCDDGLAPAMASAMGVVGYPAVLIDVDAHVAALAPLAPTARRSCCCG